MDEEADTHDFVVQLQFHHQRSEKYDPSVDKAPD
jgi:hypothetical protein